MKSATIKPKQLANLFYFLLCVLFWDCGAIFEPTGDIARSESGEWVGSSGDSGYCFHFDGDEVADCEEANQKQCYEANGEFYLDRECPSVFTSTLAACLNETDGICEDVSVGDCTAPNITYYDESCESLGYN